MFEIIHIADVWSDMRKTISAVCTLAHENGDYTYAVSYKCVCLFTDTFQTTLCIYILFCENNNCNARRLLERDCEPKQHIA